MKKLMAVAAIGAMALSIAAVAVAKRKVVRVGSTVTIQLTDTPDKDTASGTVISRVAGCKANRPVQLYYQSDSAGDVLIKEVRSKADGSWQATIPGGISLDPNNSSNGYYAVMRPKRLLATRKVIKNCTYWSTAVSQGALTD